jgi:hypothetical protein
MEHPILDCLQSAEKFILDIPYEAITEEDRHKALKEVEEVKEKVVILLKEKLI